MRIFAVLAFGCTTVATEPRWNDGRAGRWLPGDLHVHSSIGSNDTRLRDGSVESFPETIVAVARDRDMAWLVITDHSNSAGSLTTTTVEDGNLWNRGPEFPLWDLAKSLSSDSFLLIDGSEISPVSMLTADQCINCSTTGTGDASPVGHIGCIPSDLRQFDTSGAFIDRPPGAVTGAAGIQQCHARGGFAILNHPFPKAAPWIEYDWTSFDYDAIEVINGGVAFDSSDWDAFSAYLCDRLQGRDVVAVGGSDNHRTRIPYDALVTIDEGPPLGLPMTSVFAPQLSWPAVMEALRRGRIVVHENGTFVEFRIFMGDQYRAMIGDHLPAPAQPVTVWFRGESTVVQDLLFIHVAPGACQDRRRPGSDAAPIVERTVVWQTEVDRGRFEKRVEIPLRSGLYYAAMASFKAKAFNARHFAVTNVLTIE